MANRFRLLLFSTFFISTLLGVFAAGEVSALTYEKSIPFVNLNEQLDYIDDYLQVEAFYTGDSMDIEMGDLDNDGDLDAVVGTFNYTFNISLQNKIYWNNGDGTWTEADELGLTSAWAVDLHDFDGNGYLDVMVGNYGSFFGGTSNNYLYLNNGDHTFTQTQQFGAGTTTDAYIMDINKDGLMDVINPTVSTNFQYINNGDGTFTSSAIFGGGNTMELDLFDIDSDGDLDALKGEYSGTSTYRINNGNGTYTNYSITSLTVGDIEVIDYDKDNDWDFVVGLHGQNLLYTNNNNTSWTPSNEFGALNTNDLIIFDVDGNTYDDVIVANGSWGSSQNNYVYFNNGDGTWTPMQMFGAGSTYDINVADVDGNGSTDIVAANWHGSGANYRPDYIYLNGYYSSTKTLSYNLNAPVQDFDKWTNIDVSEILNARNYINYTVYEQDSNTNNDCTDETELASQQSSTDGNVDLSSFNITNNQICIVIELSTDNPSSTPTLTSFAAEYLTTTGGITGKIILDDNKNMSFDMNEDGIPDLRIILLDENGNEVDSVYTDIDGNFVFGGLPPGNYVLRIEFPDGYQSDYMEDIIIVTIQDDVELIILAQAPLAQTGDSYIMSLLAFTSIAVYFIQKQLNLPNLIYQRAAR
ncbi:VCBS repeat-containing protein [Candidatus Dojkabacteria bacterium]|uniref:VCBS repeat-containing protein n=1 Tax=Candidatus Dojkabacteria bacterium TaxID=2099670 RepID=A0A955RJN5_9BACT|nr:VCBS repeat-containing protein [Candidatus Dojkabacteria bacterium]